MTTVSVIVPVKNERGTIARITEEIPEMGDGTEIIFVEGGSTDGTYEEIREQIHAHQYRNVRFVKQTGKGKANAVELGFNAAKGDILMILDGDLTVSPSDLPLFYAKTWPGVLVVGSRMLEISPSDNTMRPLNVLGNHCFARLLTWLCGQRVRDVLCGTKSLMKSDWLKMGMLSFDPFGDFSLIFGAVDNGMAIVNRPVVYHARTYGRTQIHRFRDGLQLLYICLIWRLRCHRKKSSKPSLF